MRQVLIILVMTQLAISGFSKEKPTRMKLPTPEQLAALPPDGGEKYNRLVFEQSPYLLQHAGNPVDWYPWGDEAFEKAKKENRMVFLSIGYSTCHWCHVMEHESFEDEEVAALMNEAFICIKVDREERPDIDNIYMTVTQAMTGSGGWPMTVMLTPDKKPFFAGTYFPKNGKYGRAGMMQLIPQLKDVWHSKREEAEKYAESITAELQKMAVQPAGDPLQPGILNQAYQELKASFDHDRGGFKAQRKFPLPHNLIYLLRYWHRSGEGEALMMVERTLQAMRHGGLWDHIGYGTHRYSTDPDWLLPHFEKMLYDQALLAMAHVETFQATGKSFYRETADEIFSYVLRDMTSEAGGFFSAEDADSEGEEGLFYTWTEEEIIEALGMDDASRFLQLFQFKKGGNFADESTGHFSGRNIPHLKSGLGEEGKKFGWSPEESHTKIEQWRKKLFDIREKRVHPLKDDKILTDWNGLMIAAFAKAGAAFGNAEYIIHAEKAADFVLRELRREDGRLMKRHRRGTSGLEAHLEDYTFLCWGLIELYQASQNPKYLKESMAIADMFIDLFLDEKNGGFFLVADDSEKMIARSKEIYDGAIPSGNAAAALCLTRLSRLTGRTHYQDTADQVFKAFSNTVSRAPSNFCLLMTAYDFASGPSAEIMIADNQSPSLVAGKLMTHYFPRSVIMVKSQADQELLAKLAPFTASQSVIEGKTTIYVCQNHTCLAPVHSHEEALTSLQKVFSFENQ